MIWVIVASVCGVGLYPMLQAMRERGSFRFVPQTPDDFFVFLHSLYSHAEEADGDDDDDDDDHDEEDEERALLLSGRESLERLSPRTTLFDE